MHYIITVNTELYPRYFDQHTHGISNPWNFDPPTHGILNPLPMLFWPPYPWYFDPPAYFLIRNEGVQNTMGVQFTIPGGGRRQTTRREPLTMGKQLVNLSLAAASRVHLFCNLQSRARTHAVLVIGLYELLGNPTT